ncbi:hypothetical protein A5819_003522 [Enterococcus sp. 7E2_DIV0204]|uniref:hypothetical protein n=1 Tax=unclassified Enterococcus TaxID=2608891 RepID=UPI000A350206|nr:MULTISPECIES: hypothetical protein [unclassified Enterococcus]OTN83972.1 hypothetical protein A5819_003522 [Enterococcus sp. 7E2_DIV0204]OTP46880.1 hypothetical protein A5884_003758 [Enterococcus sp. 7D2_DIV0200]
MFYAIALALGVVVGLVSYPNIASIFKFQERGQERAICKKFDCKKNEFTYFYSENDDFFIATVNGKEYHIKFSQKKPTQVIYSEELFTTPN